MFITFPLCIMDDHFSSPGMMSIGQSVVFAYDKWTVRELVVRVSYGINTLHFCTTAVVRTGMCHVKAVFMVETLCKRGVAVHSL